MKRFLFFLLLWLFLLPGFSQNFFDRDYHPRKNYLILANPTVTNIQTVEYLINAGLLDIRKGKTKFVGVFHSDQQYDFKQTREYLDRKGLKEYYLYEVSGNLDEGEIFRENGCSGDFKKLFHHSSGIIFFGGPDIPPGVYGEENTRSVITDPGRHYFEVSLMFHLLGSTRNPDYRPLLSENPLYMVTGFCLGMQTMNVATGGTLIQDIPAEIYGAITPESVLKTGRANLHRNYWQEISEDTLIMKNTLHTIEFTSHPFFSERTEVNERMGPRVYSHHHQAVEKTGKDLEVTAVSSDRRIVEGLAHKIYPHVFAVQFHPEIPGLYEDLNVRKFHPDDKPMTLNDMLDKSSLRFHKKYWAYISEVIKKSGQSKKLMHLKNK